MYRPVHAAPAQQRAVRRVDDSIDFEFCDVCLQNSYSISHSPRVGQSAIAPLEPPASTRMSRTQLVPRLPHHAVLAVRRLPRRAGVRCLHSGPRGCCFGIIATLQRLQPDQRSLCATRRTAYTITLSKIKNLFLLGPAELTCFRPNGVCGPSWAVNPLSGDARWIPLYGHPFLPHS